MQRKCIHSHLGHLIEDLLVLRLVPQIRTGKEIVTPEPLDGSGHMKAIADADSQPSASDRGESASDDGDEDCFEEDLVAGDVAELDVAEGGEDDGGDRSEEVSFQWRNTFLFTKIFNGPGGSWSGYQVSCKLHGGHHCRVGRSFHTHGGHDATLAKMKTWCVLGSARSVKTAHQHKFDVVFPDDPMCDVDLEAYPLPPLDDAPAHEVGESDRGCREAVRWLSLGRVVGSEVVVKSVKATEIYRSTPASSAIDLRV